jgi:hypothetical protein
LGVEVEESEGKLSGLIELMEEKLVLRLAPMGESVDRALPLVTRAPSSSPADSLPWLLLIGVLFCACPSTA